MRGFKSLLTKTFIGVIASISLATPVIYSQIIAGGRNMQGEAEVFWYRASENRWRSISQGKLGTATGFYPPLDAWGFPVLGLPGGRARRRRPSRASSLLRKLSLPSGRPVCVRSRICASSPSFNTRLNSLRHAWADICSYQPDRSSSSDVARSSVCAAALDHSYRHGRRHSLARTGFNSTYRIASQKCRSSRAQE